jgi:hypothetical protein
MWEYCEQKFIKISEGLEEKVTEIVNKAELRSSVLHVA